MKKKLLVLSGIIICLLTIILMISSCNNSDKIIYENSNESSKAIINSNAITMMYETEASSGEYQISNDATWPQEGYTFNGTLSRCENGGTLSWNSETNRVVLQTNNSDRCYLYFDKEPPLTELCSGKSFAECITTQVYTGTDSDNGLYYHDGTGTYGTLEAGDNSYRYAGANPNNYVCFGSDEATCPADNLYRIIGVFNGQVKLIKADYAGSNLLGMDGDYSGLTYTDWWEISNYYKGTLFQDQSTLYVYYWDGQNGLNTWSESQLNTVNLNAEYVMNIGRTWASMIAMHTWQVGGGTADNLIYSNVQTAYDYEVGKNAENATYQAEVGLMYVSDYGYAASPENWTTILNECDVTTTNNWMHMGLAEWTLSRYSTDISNRVFAVRDNCGVYYDEVYLYNAVRPVFYLQSWVLYSSGDGTQENPFRIGL